MYKLIKLIGNGNKTVRHQIKVYDEIEPAIKRFSIYFNSQDLLLKPFIRYGIEEVQTGRLLIERNPI